MITYEVTDENKKQAIENKVREIITYGDWTVLDSEDKHEIRIVYGCFTIILYRMSIQEKTKIQVSTADENIVMFVEGVHLFDCAQASYNITKRAMRESSIEFFTDYKNCGMEDS